MNWVEIIDIVLQRILIPLGVYLVILLGNYIKSKGLDGRIERLLLQVADASERAVSVVMQTFVDDLKKSGEWNADTAKQALDMALGIAKEILGDEAMKLIGSITDEVDDYLKTAIENAVRIDKLN